MNINISNDKNYVEKGKEIISTAIIQYSWLSKVLVWEYLKRVITEFSISYSINKSKNGKDREKQLEKDLNYLELNNAESILNQNDIIEKEKKIRT